VAGATTRLEFNSDANFGNVTSIINAVTLTGGATLHRSGDSGSLVGSATPLNLGTGGGTITYGGYTAASLGFSLTGSGAFNLSAGNKGVTLSGDNSAHTGGFNINSGNLYFSNTQSLPPAGSLLVNGNGALGCGGAYYTIQEWLDSDRIDPNSTGQIQLLNRGGTGSNTSNAETIDMTGYNSLFLGASDVVNLGTNNILRFSGTITPAGNAYRLSGGRGATLALVNANILTATNNLIVGNGTFGGTAVNLNASNNFTGTTTVAANNNNKLVVAASNALGTGAVSMLGKSSLSMTGSVTCGNALALNGAPDDANTGALHNSGGANVWTGGITLGGNSRIVAANSAGSSLTLGGNIALGTRTLGFTTGATGASIGGDIIVSGQLTGSGAITKKGSGMLILNGAGSHTGALNVTAGTLGGIGMIGGPLVVSGSATVAPGSPGIGTLHTGAVTLSGTLAVEIDGANCDKLVSSGAIDLTGSTLAVSLLGNLTGPYVIAQGTSLTGTMTVPSGYVVDVSNGTQAVLTKTGGTADFAGWASANGVTGGPNGDSDHDGIPNAVEYALSLDPASSDGTPGSFSGNVVTFHKRAATSGNSDLIYRIEVSSDLGVSDPWAEVAAYLQNDSTIISANMAGESPAKFARLRVIVAP
jgi:autotransporter-associated beta strand protein